MRQVSDNPSHYLPSGPLTPMSPFGTKQPKRLTADYVRSTLKSRVDADDHAASIVPFFDGFFELAKWGQIAVPFCAYSTCAV